MKTIRNLSLVLVGIMVAAENLAMAGPLASADLPPKVHQAVLAKSSAGTVVNINQTIDDGETNYDVVFKKDNVERQLTFSDDGDVTWTEVFAGELPATVRRVMDTEFKGLKPVEFYRVTEDDDPYYDLEIPSGKATNSLAIAESGRWWSLDLEIDGAPAAVQAVVKREFGRGDFDSISKTTEEGKVYYEAEGTRNGRDVHLDIAPAGEIISREEEVTFEQMSLPARKTVSAHFDEKQITSITRHSEGNDVTFEVEADQGGKTVNMVVGRGGRIRGQ